MSQSNHDAMVVLFAGYGSVDAAVDAYDAVCAVYGERGADDAAYYDAAVINPRETDPNSRVLRETSPFRQQEGSAARVEGLAKRVARYIGEGLALTGGPAGGSGQDLPVAASTGDAAGPLDSDDLKKLGAVQETASVVLIGIFPALMGDRIDAATNGADARASTELYASAEQIEAQIVSAERSWIR